MLSIMSLSMVSTSSRASSCRMEPCFPLVYSPSTLKNILFEHSDIVIQTGNFAWKSIPYSHAKENKFTEQPPRRKDERGINQSAASPNAPKDQKVIKYTRSRMNITMSTRSDSINMPFESKKRKTEPDTRTEAIGRKCSYIQPTVSHKSSRTP